MFYIERDNMLLIKLPLTQPTGLVRVKRRKSVSEIGKPVATRSVPMTYDCYLEWQIAYDTPDKDNSLNKIAFDRVKVNDNSVQRKYLYELSDFLFSAIKLNLLSKHVLTDLCRFAECVGAEDFIEVNYPPTRNEIDKRQFEQLKFDIFNQELPVLVNHVNKLDIELMVQPKQRAVGNQAMLFLAIPISELNEWHSLNGRLAEPKEEGTFVIDNTNCSILVNLMKCFILSSEQHKSDIINIIQAIQGSL